MFARVTLLWVLISWAACACAQREVYEPLTTSPVVGMDSGKLKALEERARRGERKALNRLDEYYATQGKDHLKRALWERLGAQTGDIFSQSAWAGTCHWELCDAEAARKWYRVILNHPEITSQTVIQRNTFDAVHALDSQGVAPGGAKDYMLRGIAIEKERMKVLRKLLAKEIGPKYELSAAKATELEAQAGSRRDAGAAFRLFQHYGAVANDTEAYFWLWFSAQYGNPEAQRALARAIASTPGDDKDEADEWPTTTAQTPAAGKRVQASSSATSDSETLMFEWPFGGFDLRMPVSVQSDLIKLKQIRFSERKGYGRIECWIGFELKSLKSPVEMSVSLVGPGGKVLSTKTDLLLPEDFGERKFLSDTVIIPPLQNFVWLTEANGEIARGLRKPDFPTGTVIPRDLKSFTITVRKKAASSEQQRTPGK